MKKLVIIVLISFSSFFSFSQENDWLIHSFSTAISLHAVDIDDQGDIYVFGEENFGAMSSDNGRTWTNINLSNKYASSKIVSVMAIEKKIFLLFETTDGKNFIQYFDKKEFRENNSPNLHYLLNIKGLVQGFGNEKVFIKNTGESYDLNYFGEILLPYNFYLPYYQFSLRCPSCNYSWFTTIGQDERILSVFRRDGIIQSIMYSDDNGFNWTESEIDVIKENSILYVIDISFFENHAYFLGTHYGAYDFSLFESNDNGESWNLLGRNLYAGEGEIPRAKFILKNRDKLVVVGNIINFQDEFISSFVQEEENVLYFSERINAGSSFKNIMVLVGEKGLVLIHQR